MKNRQNLLDLGIQEHGNAQAAFDLALTNNLSLTEELIVGNVLKVEASENADTDIYNYYNENNISPVTASPLLPPEGVGFGIIENTFYIG